MAAQTGRTVTKFEKFQVDDTAGTLRDLNIKTISGAGVDYEDVDLTARNDPATGGLPGIGTVKISITCVFDTLAAQAASGSAAAPAFSGSHTVLSAINGAQVPLTLGFYKGVRHNWETGEPCIGLTSTATSGFLCRNYQVDGDECSADFILYPGSALPAWGTAAFT